MFSSAQPLARRLLAVVLPLAFNAACIGQTCETHGQEAQRYTDGRTNEARSFYESSSVDGRYLFFPAGRRYRFEHGLSEAPSEFAVYLSWVENPSREGAGFAESAGNQAIFEVVDEQVIEVRNDTCAEFYMRLFARVAPFEQSEVDSGTTATSADVGNPATTSPDAGNELPSERDASAVR